LRKADKCLHRCKMEKIRECLQVYVYMRADIFVVYEQFAVMVVARYRTNTANTKNVEKLYRCFCFLVV